MFALPVSTIIHIDVKHISCPPFVLSFALLMQTTSFQTVVLSRPNICDESAREMTLNWV